MQYCTRAACFITTDDRVCKHLNQGYRVFASRGVMMSFDVSVVLSVTGLHPPLFEQTGVPWEGMGREG
jgi:hypothetical protein